MVSILIFKNPISNNLRSKHNVKFMSVCKEDEVQVAVKRVSHESKQGMREFVSEIASSFEVKYSTAFSDENPNAYAIM